jgi:transposase
MSDPHDATVTARMRTVVKVWASGMSIGDAASAGGVSHTTAGRWIHAIATDDDVARRPRLTRRQRAHARSV